MRTLIVNSYAYLPTRRRSWHNLSSRTGLALDTNAGSVLPRHGHGQRVRVDQRCGYNETIQFSLKSSRRLSSHCDRRYELEHTRTSVLSDGSMHRLREGTTG